VEVRIPIGLVVVLIGILATIGIATVALFLFRPDWLGLSPPKQAVPADTLHRGDTLAADTFLSPSPWDELQEQLHQQTGLITQLQDSLRLVRHLADSLKTELRQLQDSLAQWQRRFRQQSDSLRIAHYEAFAKIYNTAPPGEVARVLAQLSPADAALILRLMNRRQAARVAAALPPEQAAAVLTTGVPR